MRRHFHLWYACMWLYFNIHYWRTFEAPTLRLKREARAGAWRYFLGQLFAFTQEESEIFSHTGRIATSVRQRARGLS
jgi:hypothetical protein